ncbi:MAG: hypothetical protein QOJ00_2783 [Actinomycetota bacterium]|jgi:predicted 3-demethylubiquinone-9 3-methyltransferase (glyoxalase superfamily)
MPKIIPNLWFDDQALEAAEYYCSIFPNSQVKEVIRYTDVGPGEPGTILNVEFWLDGQRFLALNGGPHDSFNDAISLQVDCEDQDEIDYYWERLTAGGGVAVQCGWLKDKFGVSWQVVPVELPEIVGDFDRDRADRAVAAILEMDKIDIAVVRAAADGDRAEKKPTGVAGVVKRVADKLSPKKAPADTAETAAKKDPTDAAGPKAIDGEPTGVADTGPVPTKPAARKGAAAKKTTAQRSAVKKTAPAKKAAAAKSTAPKKSTAATAPAPRKSAPKKSAPKKSAPKKTAAKGTAKKR